MPASITKETIQLPCRLSDAERLERGIALATTLGPARQKGVKRDAKVLREARAQVKALRDAVLTASEVRDVECEWRPVWSDLRMDCVRLDTGALVSARPMTDLERQTELFEAAE